MEILKILAVLLNLIFCSVTIYFLRPLRWQYQEDRASIIGFVGMVVTYILSAILIIF